jgi:hypothetical protein
MSGMLCCATGWVVCFSADCVWRPVGQCVVLSQMIDSICAWRPVRKHAAQHIAMGSILCGVE